MTIRTRNRLALIATFVLAVVIAVATLTPQQQMPPTPSGADKIFHFIAFAGLVFPAIALRPRLLWWLLPAAILYGGVIEIIQPMFGRGMELGDFIANTLGAGAGAGAGWVVHFRFLRRRIVTDERRPAPTPARR